MNATSKNWIEQGSEKSYTKHEGLDGKIIVTTSQATIINVDGKSSIEELLVAHGNRDIVDQINANKARILDPAGEEYSLEDIPELTDQVLITNITKAA